MRYILYGLKYAIAHGASAADKSDQYLEALSCEEFQQCVSRPDARMAQVEDLLQILINETDFRQASYMKIEDETIAGGSSKYDELVAKACKALSKNDIIKANSSSDSP